MRFVSISVLFGKSISDWVRLHLEEIEKNLISPSSEFSSLCGKLYTVESDLIATEMLAFPSKSSGNENYSDLMIVIMI